MCSSGLVYRWGHQACQGDYRRYTAGGPKCFVLPYPALHAWQRLARAEVLLHRTGLSGHGMVRFLGMTQGKRSYPRTCVNPSSRNGRRGTACTLHGAHGDQALLHDLNALALVAGASVPVYVIVTNNHSGAIFHFFELGNAGERLRNPHPWGFLRYHRDFSPGIRVSILDRNVCCCLSGSPKAASLDCV